MSPAATQSGAQSPPDPAAVRTGVSVLAFMVLVSVVVVVVALLLLRRYRHGLLGLGRGRSRKKKARVADAWKESERRLERDDDTVDLDPGELGRG